MSPKPAGDFSPTMDAAQRALTQDEIVMNHCWALGDAACSAMRP